MKHTPILMPMALSSPIPREKFDSRIMFTLNPTLEKRLDIFVAEANSTRSEMIREALIEFLDPRPRELPEVPQTFTAPMLGSIPCGPWSASDESSERFSVTTEVADELELRDGDWWFRSSGPSMIGAGILDGSMVAVRPYEGKPPRRGDVIALQIADEAGEVVGTFKRFAGYNGDVPKLLDGNDEPFDLPEGGRVAAILARGVGVVSRL